MGRAYRWELQGACTTSLVRIAAATVRPGNTWQARRGLCNCRERDDGKEQNRGYSHKHACRIPCYAYVMKQHQPWQRRSTIALIVLSVSVIFFVTTDNDHIWPLRNLLHYRFATWWHERMATDTAVVGTAILQGCVYNTHHQPIPDALVLLAEPTGQVHTTTTTADGCYRLPAIPTGRYVPLAVARGYDPAVGRSWGLPLRVAAGIQPTLDFQLPPVGLPTLQPGSDLRLSPPVTRSWELPQPGTAVRREILFDSGGRPNQLTFLYTPRITAENWPMLLVVYPGQADWWEGVSIPLAAAGYAVLAVGPAYSLNLEPDIDELQRLVAFARAGRLPGVDGRRIAVLGGSYSSLHVFRLLQRDSGFRCAVSLGGASDLFDLRQRFEAGQFTPPSGLDQALIALGTPDMHPIRYWRYSARYQLRTDLPVLAILHSRDDEVVPFEQSQLLVTRLEQLGVPHEAYFFDGMSHYLLADRPSAELTWIYNLILDFLQRTI